MSDNNWVCELAESIMTEDEKKQAACGLAIPAIKSIRTRLACGLLPAKKQGLLILLQEQLALYY